MRRRPAAGIPSGEIGDGRFAFHHGSLTDPAWQDIQACAGGEEIFPWLVQIAGGIHLQIDEPLDCPQGMAKHVTCAFHGAEQIADHGKTAAFGIGEVKCRSSA